MTERLKKESNFIIFPGDSEKIQGATGGTLSLLEKICPGKIKTEKN